MSAGVLVIEVTSPVVYVGVLANEIMLLVVPDDALAEERLCVVTSIEEQTGVVEVITLAEMNVYLQDHNHAAWLL